jgi:ribosomal protein S18 acetylase RimI-like enzyme
MMDGKIRGARKKDLMRIQDIIYDCVYVACDTRKEMIKIRNNYTLKNLEKYFLNSEGFFVFEKDGEVLGSGRITKGGIVKTIYVDPAFHGRGIGETIVKKILRFARRNGHDKITLNAISSAVGFYQKQGFVKGKIFKTRDNEMMLVL